MRSKTFFCINLPLSLLVIVVFSACANLRKSVSSDRSSHTLSQTTGAPYFLFLSDLHLEWNRKTTSMGEDAGTDLWNHCLKKLDSLIHGGNPPAFVLYTGDMPVHYHCSSYCGLDSLPDSLTIQHYFSINAVLTGFSKLVSNTKIPFLYVPGNNDAVAGNYYAFSGAGYPTPFSLMPGQLPTYPYDSFHVSKTYTANGAYMVSDSSNRTGYYAAKVMNGLRVIGLNTVMWGPYFNGVTSAEHWQMGTNEMNWLQRQLKDAQDSGDRVYLAMHIPPGIDAYSKKSMWWDTLGGGQSWQNIFLSLVSTYKQSIAGIFFGHTHFDELRLLYDDASTAPMQVAISCPGISTQHYNNPAFKTVNFNPVSKVPIDFTTWYTTPEASYWGNGTYSFSTVFHAGTKDTSIYQTLKNMPLDSIKANMNTIYTAHNDTSFSYSSFGIQVNRIPLKK